MMHHSPETHLLLLRHMDQLAPNVDGHCCLSLLMHKVKAHLRYGRDIVGSERWQRQLQQQFHIRFQHLGSSEDTTYIKEYERLMYEKNQQR